MKNKNLTYTILISAIIFGGFIYLAIQNKSGIKSSLIEPATAISEMGTGSKIIDVRTPEEYKEGYVYGALNIDWENQNDFIQKVSNLPKDDKYILYCRSGNRSQQAMEYMIANGFTNVSSVRGGVLTGELPLVKPESDLSTHPETVEENLKSLLDIAIMDEYKAKATYERVLEKYPEEKPFVNIINAENNHINSLLSLYKKYNISPPIYTNDLPAYSGTLSEACRVGGRAEIENAKLYTDNLLPKVGDYSDIKNVFTSLYLASQNNHLPAFQRCSK